MTEGIDNLASSQTPVVTVFLTMGGKVLILKRSQKVGSFRGYWAGISGHVENDPVSQAIIEIEEETGLGPGEVKLINSAEPFVVRGEGSNWKVHPFLFEKTGRGAIRLDWEHDEMRWINPDDLVSYRTVPGLEKGLSRVYPPR